MTSLLEELLKAVTVVLKLKLFYFWTEIFSIFNRDGFYNLEIKQIERLLFIIINYTTNDPDFTLTSFLEQPTIPSPYPSVLRISPLLPTMSCTTVPTVSSSVFTSKVVTGSANLALASTCLIMLAEPATTMVSRVPLPTSALCTLTTQSYTES